MKISRQIEKLNFMDLFYKGLINITNSMEHTDKFQSELTLSKLANDRIKLTIIQAKGLDF